MNFIETMKEQQAKTTLKFTENGALGYTTSGKKILDMNFKTSSYRNLSESEIAGDFADAFAENPVMSLRWLFYARDIRGGMGERRLFRVILQNLALTQPEVARRIVSLVPEYGRYDDLLCLLGTSLQSQVIGIIQDTLVEDLKNVRLKKPISLIAKWLPSCNASSKTTVQQANIIRTELHLTHKQYRAMLTKLRAYLRVVEVDMSKNRWSKIDYSAVPSKANVKYNKAFWKRDPERRAKFIQKVEKGEAKINSGTNFPHDIVHSYTGSRSVDGALEALWKALPKEEEIGNTLVVADGSGSMGSTIGNTRVTALEVANALAVYFAERCEGGYQNNYITFSQTPKLVNLGNGTLLSKLQIAKKHNEVANTNIEAVFNLILDTAVSRNLSQEDLPETILIISDMEFDEATSTRSGYWNSRPVPETLFQTITQRYTAKGYKMPRLVFWNVMSRNMVIPVTTNELGVSLISGFSQSAIKMAMTGQTDPYFALRDILMGKRYEPVAKAVGSI